MEKLNEDYSYIKGWVFIDNQDVKDFDTRLVLYSQSDDGSALSFRLKMIERKDVTNYFKNKYDYDYSGFEGKISNKFFDENSYIGFLIKDANEYTLVKTEKRLFYSNEKISNNKD